MGGQPYGFKGICSHAIGRARRSPSGPLLTSLLATCALLACLPATALAVPPTYDVRGEWSFTLESPKHREAATSVFREVSPNGEFSGSSSINGSPGTFSGKIEGVELSMRGEAHTPLGLATFVSSTGTVENEGNAITTSGTLTIGSEAPEAATMKGTKIKTLAEVQARELREEEERIQREKEAREKAQKEKEEAEKAAKEKEEREIAERPAREQREREEAEKAAREKQEREAAEKAARETQAREAAEKQARERQEQEARAARERLEREQREKSATLIAASPLGGSFTPSLISLNLTNANGFAVSGHLTLRLLAVTGAGSGSAKTKHKTAKAVALGEGSFSISPKGTGAVKVKLTRGGRAALARRKALPVKVTITTQSSGQAPVTKTYSLTLRASAHAHH